MLGEVALERRRAQPAADRHRARLAIECDDAVEPRRVERDHGRMRAAQRRDATDDARAAAERHDRDRFARAQSEQLRELRRVARQHNGIGRALGLARAQAH
jgi:hypothetical protein